MRILYSQRNWIYQYDDKTPKRISALVMTFKDDPTIFPESLNSITKQTRPFDEIIVVMDKSEEGSANHETVKTLGLKVYFDDKGTKRDAYTGAFKKTSGNIVVMLSGDTIYNLKMNAKAYRSFSDSRVGAVAFPLRVYKPERTIWTRFANIFFSLRYRLTYRCLSAKGALLCTTGETAYFRRKPIAKHLSEFVNEIAWGRRCIIGDDRFLTSMVLKESYKVILNDSIDSPCLTDSPTDFKGLIRQQCRWYRSNQRYSLKTLFTNWIPNQPFIFKFHLFGFQFLPYLWLLTFLVFIFNLVFHVQNYEITIVPMAALIVLGIISFFYANLLKGINHWASEEARPSEFVFYVLFAVSVILPVFVYALVTVRNQGSWNTKDH